MEPVNYSNVRVQEENGEDNNASSLPVINQKLNKEAFEILAKLNEDVTASNPERINDKLIKLFEGEGRLLLARPEGKGLSVMTFVIVGYPEYSKDTYQHILTRLKTETLINKKILQQVQEETDRILVPGVRTTLAHAAVAHPIALKAILDIKPELLEVEGVFPNPVLRGSMPDKQSVKEYVHIQINMLNDPKCANNLEGNNKAALESMLKCKEIIKVAEKQRREDLQKLHQEMVPENLQFKDEASIINQYLNIES